MGRVLARSDSTAAPFVIHGMAGVGRPFPGVGRGSGRSFRYRYDRRERLAPPAGRGGTGTRYAEDDLHGTQSSGSITLMLTSRSPSVSGPVGASPAIPATDSVTGPAWNPPLSLAGGLPRSREEQVRLSLRVVVHLDRIGPPGNDGGARREATQLGMAEVLSVTQGAVSKVLRRLVAAEVVGEETHHVRGLDRRVRVYFLTRPGGTLAREIRERFGLPPRLPPRG